VAPGSARPAWASLPPSTAAPRPHPTREPRQEAPQALTLRRAASRRPRPPKGAPAAQLAAALPAHLRHPAQKGARRLPDRLPPALPVAQGRARLRPDRRPASQALRRHPQVTSRGLAARRAARPPGRSRSPPPPRQALPALRLPAQARHSPGLLPLQMEARPRGRRRRPAREEQVSNRSRPARHRQDSQRLPVRLDQRRASRPPSRRHPANRPRPRVNPRPDSRARLQQASQRRKGLPRAKHQPAPASLARHQRVSRLRRLPVAGHLQLGRLRRQRQALHHPREGQHQASHPRLPLQRRARLRPQSLARRQPPYHRQGGRLDPEAEDGPGDVADYQAEAAASASAPLSEAFSRVSSWSWQASSARRSSA
jgi:hypothetical protein